MPARRRRRTSRHRGAMQQQLESSLVPNTGNDLRHRTIAGMADGMVAVAGRIASVGKKPLLLPLEAAGQGSHVDRIGLGSPGLAAHVWMEINTGSFCRTHANASASGQAPDSSRDRLAHEGAAVVGVSTPCVPKGSTAPTVHEAFTLSAWLPTGVATRSAQPGEVGERQGMDEVAADLGAAAMFGHVDVEEARRQSLQSARVRTGTL